MEATYEALRPLEPGKPVPVIERNELGALVGAWIGYWNYKSGTVTLYPDARNPFVHWPGGKVGGKKTVSDRMIGFVARKSRKE